MPSLAVLTPRQRELLGHLCAGKNLRRAAWECCIEYGTAKNYMFDARAKLGAGTMAHACVLFVLMGGVAPPVAPPSGRAMRPEFV